MDFFYFLINKLFSKQRMRVQELGSAAVLLPCAPVCSYLWIVSLLATGLEMLDCFSLLFVQDMGRACAISIHLYTLEVQRLSSLP